MLETLLTAILAAIVPALAIYFLTQLLKINTAIDALPGLIKQLIVAAEAVILTYVGAAAGIPLPPDLGLLTPELVQAGLTTLFAFLVHKLFPAKATVA